MSFEIVSMFLVAMSKVVNLKLFIQGVIDELKRLDEFNYIR